MGDERTQDRPGPRTLAALSKGRDNNLNLLRFLAATAVIWGHAWGTTGQTDREPFYHLFGIGTGDIGVDVFFVVSGFLITKSGATKELPLFAWARIVRIFPALWLSIVVTVVVFGLFVTPLHALEFWGRHDTFSYLYRNMLMMPKLGAQTHLSMAWGPGDDEVNTALWTLPHELQMYGLLALCGVLGKGRTKPLVAVLVLFGGVVFVGKVLGAPLPFDVERGRFVFFFFTGAALFFLRDKVQLHGWIAASCMGVLLASGFLTRNHAVHRLVLAATLPYPVFWFAFVPGGLLRAFNKVGDYSYGIYIWGCPVQMWMARHFGPSPFLNFGLTLAVVLPIAAASWHLLEKRALSLKYPLPVKSPLAPVPRAP